MVFIVLIFCYALGLEFEEFDGILIYMRLNWALERERNRGMRGKESG